MNCLKTIGLFFLLLITLQGAAQYDTTVVDTSNLEEVKKNFLNRVGEFFDVEMLGHTIQSRRSVKADGLKDSLKSFRDRTEGALNLGGLSRIQIDELWPNLLNRKKYYTVDGKVEADSNLQVLNVTNEFMVIGFKIQFDTVSAETYTVTITSSMDDVLTELLNEKEIFGLKDTMDQHFVDYFGTSTYSRPTDAPVADAIIALFQTLDGLLGPIYDELREAQILAGNVSETFDLARDDFKFTFAPADDYGYDSYDQAEWANHYDVVRLGDGTLMPIDFKAQLENETGFKVTAHYVGAPAELNLSQLKFETKSGDSISSTGDLAGGFELTLPQRDKDYTVYAKQGNKKLGKLHVFVRKLETRNLLIVPTGASTDLVAGNVKTALNNLYNKYLISWEVSIDSVFADMSWDQTGNGLQMEESNLLSNYSDEMKGLRDLYKEQRPAYPKDAYLVFEIPGFESSTVQGYMVRGKAMGFVKKGSGTITLAHELGHGAFGLEHTFPTVTKSSTTNLMDYAGVYSAPDNLRKFQWQRAHSNAPIISLFDEEEDAAITHLMYDNQHRLTYVWNTSATANDGIDLWDQHDFSAFYTPSGKLISVDKTKLAKWLKFDAFTGAVNSFQYEGNVYTALYLESYPDFMFHGYMREPSVWWPIVKKFFKDSLTYDQSQLEQIQHFVLPDSSQFTMEEFYNDTNKLFSWWDVEKALKNHPDMFFTDFGDVAMNDRIIGMTQPLHIEGNCNLNKVVTFEGYTSSLGQERFHSDGTIGDALWGREKPLKNFGVDVTVNQLTIIDAISFVPDNMFSVEQADMFCVVLNLYQDPGESWGKYYLQMKTLDLGYYEIDQLLMEHPEAIESIYKISTTINDLGIDLVNHYQESGHILALRKGMLQVFFRALEEAKGNGQITSLESDLAELDLYANFIAQFKEEWNKRLDSMRVELSQGDEDDLYELINTFFSGTEIFHFSWDTRVAILNCLVKDWMWDGEENAALRVLKFCPASQSTKVLEELLKFREIYSVNTGEIYAYNIFSALYSRVTGDENNEYIKVMYNLWYNSQYSYAAHPSYSYTNKPQVFNYESEQFLGFYNSNYNLSATDNFSQITIQLEASAIVPGNIYFEAAAYVYNPNVAYSYHPYQPIGILNTDSEGEVIFPSNVVPAFIFYAFDAINTNANITLGAQVAVDVVLTLAGGAGIYYKALRTGLGAVHKLSTTRKILLAGEVIEFSAGTVNTILDYACYDNDACAKWQKVLTAIEIAALSGDVIYGAVARKKAEQFLDNSIDVGQLDHHPKKADILLAMNRVAGRAGDISTQRKAFWESWIIECSYPNTKFEPLGKEYNTFKNSAVDDEMRAMYNSSEEADEYLPDIVKSGDTYPESLTVNQGDKFYKIVPKGGNIINNPSPYYLTEAEYNWIKANPSQLEQKLGLPLSQVDSEYDVFTITSKVNNNKLFQSIIAPTEQYSTEFITPNIVYSTTGGRTQSLIINNGDPDFWSKSTTPHEPLTPNSLPDYQ